MKVVVFAGPTLCSSQILEHLNADVLPPAARGDILRAAKANPVAIGLVDGYFTRVPSVWHKEILWALSQGIRVFGAASMGALRAAELEQFGMEGVGEIFDWYRSGAVQDDDEVAIGHAPMAEGYRATSEAMVNIRATLAAAVRARVIDSRIREILESIAKGLHYTDRSYRMLVTLAERQGIPHSTLVPFTTWVGPNRVDQKHLDAVSMLKHMASQAREGWQKNPIRFRFSHTDAWQALWNEVQADTTSCFGADSGRRLVEELLLLGRAQQAQTSAMVRAMALDLASRHGLRANTGSIEETIDEFRRERKLFESTEFEEWLERACLKGDAAISFFERETLVRRMVSCFQGELSQHLVDHLRASGEYGWLAPRVDAKDQTLSSLGISGSVALTAVGVTEEALWYWYFATCLGREVPPNLDSFACEQRSSRAELLAAVIREYLYRKAMSVTPDQTAEGRLRGANPNTCTLGGAEERTQ